MSYNQYNNGSRSHSGGGDNYSGGGDVRSNRGRDHHGGSGGSDDRRHDRGRNSFGGGGGQGGRGHEGRGGGGGGGGGGRGGGERSGGGRKYMSYQRCQLEENGISVQTNCYELAPKNGNPNANIYQYVVRIDVLMKKREDKPDSTYTGASSIVEEVPVTTVKSPPEKITSFLVKKKLRREVMTENDTDSTALTRHVLDCCHRKLQQVSPHQSFFHDGTNIAFSTHRLEPVPDSKLYMEFHEIFEYRREALQEPEEENEKTYSGAEQVSKKQKIHEQQDDIVEYIFCINANADDKDTDSTTMKLWYLVSFRYTNNVSMNLLSDNKAFVNCINTSLKGNMISHCIGFGKSPHMFFFQLDKQNKILPPFLARKLNNSIVPMLGLKQSVRYCAGSMYGLLLIADFGLRYMYSDAINPQTKERFSVLEPDPRNRNHAILLGDMVVKNVVHACIDDREEQKEFEKRIKKVNFDIRYYRGSDYEHKLHRLFEKQELVKENPVIKDVEITGKIRKPLTMEIIQKKKYFLKKNARLFVSTTGEPSIIWDPNTYTFPYVRKSERDRSSVTKVDYDSALIDKLNPQKEELLVEPRQVTVAEYFQDQYQLILKYPKMPLIRVKSRHKDMKEYYPVEMLLQCQDEVRNMNTEEQIKDGLKLCDEFCGKMRQKKISSLLHGSCVQNNPLQAFQDTQRDVLQKQFQLELHTEPIIVEARVLKEPILENKTSLVKISDGSLHNDNDGHFDTPSTMSSFAVINYTRNSTQELWNRCFKNLFDTCNKRGMNIAKESLQETFNEVVVQYTEQTRNLETMYTHFRSAIKKAQCHFLKANHLANVQTLSGNVMECHVQLCQDQQFVDVRQLKNDHLWTGIPVNRVDCPSIVFIVFPDDKFGSQIYSHVKLLSHVDFVVQVMNWSKASKPNNSQYLSNLSYKLNLKLGTMLTGAVLGRESAWRRTSKNWVDEVPTLVIGLSMASASGQDSLITVAGTALLDNTGLAHKQEFCVQKKGPLINTKAMIEIIKSLGVSWSKSNGNTRPERVLIYRATGDDGMFEDILGTELKAIKSAFHELNLAMSNYDCDHCDKDGCIFCLPKMTLIIAQSQHNIILAPSNDDGPVNVPSGTCVENLFPALNLSSDNQIVSGLVQELGDKSQASSDFTFPAPFGSAANATAFALVAHGGLKGTSKCVIYRVIWNENLLFRPKSSSASQLDLLKMQTLTFHLSFQYGTAPKAPRLPTVLQYSARLNNVAIGYINDRISSATAQTDPDDVYTSILGRVRGTNVEESERWTTPHHPTSMG